MNALLTWLSEAMAGAPWLAVVAAAGWGVASLVLSPCHLASIPLIVGFIAQRRATTGRQALAQSALFALGILLSIAVVGFATAMAGRMLGDLGPWPNRIVAALLVAVSLHLLGVVRLPWERGLLLPRWHGTAAALLLGVVFGVALGPCTFAYLAPVLAVVFGVSHGGTTFGMVLLLAFGIGHCALIVAAGVSTGKVQAVLDWNERSRGARRLRGACGLLVLAGAGWLVLTAPAA